MPDLYMRRDDVVTCDRGHPIARATRDVERHAIAQGDELEFFAGPQPRIGDPWPTCRRCGGVCFDEVRGVRFEDGWRV